MGGNPVNKIDPSGNIPIDTIWDAGNVLWDIFVSRDPCDLAADLAAMAIPYVPAGITKISKIAKVAEVVRPTNFSPLGAGRRGAFNEAKRQSGIPVSQQPSRVTPNVDKRGNSQPGRTYEYEVSAPGGSTKVVRIRDDAGGHDFGPGNSQNRGSHFNDEAGNHYDY